jgi:hypothetical protein
MWPGQRTWHEPFFWLDPRPPRRTRFRTRGASRHGTADHHHAEHDLGATGTTGRRSVDRRDDGFNWGWLGLLGLAGLAGLKRRDHVGTMADTRRTT